MSNLVKYCTHPNCLEQVYYRGRQYGLCKRHYQEKTASDDRLNRVLVEKYMVRRFTPEEISELVSKPISWVRDVVEDIRRENEQWLEKDGLGRLNMVVNDLLRNSRDRQNELWVAAANDPSQAVRALKALKDEDQHQMEVLQSLGYLPKSAEKLDMHHSFESAVLDLDRADALDPNVIDIQADEIPLAEFELPMERLLDASIRESDLESERYRESLVQREDAPVPSGPKEVLRKPPVGEDEEDEEGPAEAVADSDDDLQRDSEEEAGGEANPPADSEREAGWDIDPRGGLPVHKEHPTPSD
jgi:hypothetical protein